MGTNGHEYPGQFYHVWLEEHGGFLGGRALCPQSAAGRRGNAPAHLVFQPEIHADKHS